MKEVPRVDQGHVQKIDEEWRNLQWPAFSEDCDVLTFYRKLMEVEDQEGNKKFQIFETFALQLFLPVSNADAERLLKKKKNVIPWQLSSITALIALAECVRGGPRCPIFKPTQAMLDCISKLRV